jgi:two-component system cell cycle response regulator
MAARILVIEDNSGNLELITYLLNGFGYPTVIARNGEAGLGAARREAPDLILCDIQMPVMDGYEVARQLKAHPTLNRIPLVAISSLAMVGDRDKILSSGFDGYISKPIDPEAFIGQIESVLRSNPTASGLTGSATGSSPFAKSGEGLTILVVDSSPFNVRCTRTAFELFGYKVLSADNVAAGLSQARQVLPDLILSEVRFPNENGFDFIREAKADPHLKTIPFVFISTAAPEQTDKPSALALGAAEFICRPIAPGALRSTIEDCLKK